MKIKISDASGNELTTLDLYGRNIYDQIWAWVHSNIGPQASQADFRLS